MNDERWLIVDTETDGCLTPIHAVEIAAQRMRGWRRDGTPFRALLNHDVPIDPGAQAVHGYSRTFLRQHGAPPLEAHAEFRDYARDLPLVAYNLSFDWDRVLFPEYGRLGVPTAGRRGFCALTLSRRVVRGPANYRLDTLKQHFRLNPGSRSHHGDTDVETITALFEQVLAPTMERVGLVGFETVAAFSKHCPVATCQEWVYAERPDGARGDFWEQQTRPSRRVRRAALV